MFNLVKLVFVCACLFIVSSCASKVGGQATLDPQNITTNGEPAKSQLIVSAEGVRGNSNGTAPSGVMQDAQGTYYGSTGPFGTFTLDKKAELLFITSPNDGDIQATNLSYTQDPTSGTLITASEVRIKFNVTDNILAQNMAFEDAAEVIMTIAPEQRQETIEQWQAAGNITSNVAAQLLKLYVPVP